ncbi:hypothetical protein [Lentilactobacillus kefiri]|uniref:hypothetical protein n=1 Tax=Lentilactobacillus kefiri TaxID=33962 RepID=UPI0020739651|nr:hypothetical protein [Lentilactobacillus kefiri]
MKANLNELRYKGTLNKLGYKTLANGNTIPANIGLFDFRFGYFHMSLQTNIQANVLDQLTNTVTIFARHNDSFVGDDLHTITIDDVSYNIKEIEPDFDINGCDVLILKRTGA